ncbi:MAG: lytic transglycosylase domain-containing protein [Candidatus Berkelbacteria bacterium]
MKKTVQFIIVTVLMVGFFLGFYYFYPHVWGEILYPLDYQDSIKKYALEDNVDPNLVCAFIYTESHFNKDSTSGVGARGLMQIMPATAAGIAQEIGDNNYSSSKLFDPDTNIRYGTWYIKGLYEQYNGDVSMVAAGYNAGRARADDWRDRGRGLPTETVYFVQKIKNTKEMYDKIYGKWWANPEVQKPNAFYQGIGNFQNFASDLITGKR